MAHDGLGYLFILGTALDHALGHSVDDFPLLKGAGAAEGVGTVKLQALFGRQLFPDYLAASCNLSGEAAELLTFV
jgi:hypothetical protein